MDTAILLADNKVGNDENYSIKISESILDWVDKLTLYLQRQERRGELTFAQTRALKHHIKHHLLAPMEDVFEKLSW